MKRILIAALLASAFAAGAMAQELKIGSTYNPSVDPHYLYVVPNIGYNRHLYEPLVAQTADKVLVPGLAVSWEAVEPTRWRFKLREGVKFHDGTPFTADDVVFSYGRVTAIPNNPGSYAPYLSGITGVEKVDDLTVDIVTDVPNPLVPDQTNGILIVSRAAAEGRAPADFDSGAAAIGTGPFKYGELLKGESLRLLRNEDYWGEKPAWESVKFTVMTDAGARTVALETGEADLIDLVRPSDADRLAKIDNISVARATTNRILFISASAKPESHPLVTDAAGKPLAANPFADVRVRKAMSLALNRPGMVDRIFAGYAEATAQLATPGTIGYLEDRGADPFSVEEAQKLMAEAGFADGFKTAFWCPNLDVYPQLCQAAAQMFARIGIVGDVQLMPSSSFFSQVNPPANPAPLWISGWNNLYGNALNALIPNVHSYSAELNLGGANAAGFSNPEADRLIDAAKQELDPAKHAAMVQDAMRLAVENYAVIPIARVDTIFATSKNIVYTPGSLNLTLAAWAKPAK